MRKRDAAAATILALCATTLVSCSSTRTVIVHGPTPTSPDTASLTHPPEERTPTIAADFMEQTVFRPLRAPLNPPGLLRSVFAGDVEAYNVTAADDVEDSGWFIHRNTRGGMTAEAVARGATRGSGPDTSGVWTVTRAKLEGGTPGFAIRDATGDEYLVKFDPPDHVELGTAAEIISSRLFYAVGYNTPELFIAAIDPAKIKPSGSLTFEDRLGREHPVSDEDVQRLLRGVGHTRDGLVRVAASRIVPGAIGPFSYEGTRPDDPVDTIPHQHRRELRGLYVMAAWLNHWDTKQNNTLDVYVEEDGWGFVRHYLIDFGSTLAARGVRPHTPRDGTEAHLDYPRIAARLFTAGFYAAPWERLEYELEYSALGYYAAEPYDPGGWMTGYPNPAFRRRTIRDGYWGAKLVASFDEEQIRAAVSAGELSDPAAAEALTRAILARQEKTVRYWFVRVTPLEALAVTGTPSEPVLGFRDLAVAQGIVVPRVRRYEFHFELPAAGIEIEEDREVNLSPDGRGEVRLPSPGGGGSGIWESLAAQPVEKRLARLELRAIPEGGSPRPRDVRIYLLPDRERGYRIVGRRY